MPQPNLTRTLASVLRPKLGGNVGHTWLTANLEQIDNALDAFADQMWISKDDKYLYIADNGTGMSELAGTLLLAKTGKKDRIGQKNQGFLDALVYQTGLKGIHYVWSRCRETKRMKRLKLDFNEFAAECEALDADPNVAGVNYDALQAVLQEGITENDHADTMCFLQNFEKVRQMFDNELAYGGTCIMFEYGPDVPDDITPLGPYAQHMYVNYEFILHIQEELYPITATNNVLMSEKYRPVTFTCKRWQGVGLQRTLYEFSSNGSYRNMYVQDTAKTSRVLTESELEAAAERLEQPGDTVWSADYSVLSMNDSNSQRELLLGLDEQLAKAIWVKIKGKILGMPVTYGSITTASLRYQLDGRFCVTIHAPDVVSRVTEINKSKANLEHVTTSTTFAKFLEYCKHDFLRQEDQAPSLRTNGVPDMAVLVQAGSKQNPDTPTRDPFLRPWTPTCYFGYIGVGDGGVRCDDDELLLKFGVTKVNPDKRRAAYKKEGNMQLVHTVFVGAAGAEDHDGKMHVEWCIRWALSQLPKSGTKLRWRQGSDEFFHCPRDYYNLVADTVWDVMRQHRSGAPCAPVGAAAVDAAADAAADAAGAAAEE